jgi:hypothetical protein
MPNVSLVAKPVIPVFRHSNWSKNPCIPYILFSQAPVKHLEGSGGGKQMMNPSGHYVPISHDDRYFSCSGVRVSISTPSEASFNRAISWSI